MSEQMTNTNLIEKEKNEMVKTRKPKKRTRFPIYLIIAILLATAIPQPSEVQAAKAHKHAYTIVVGYKKAEWLHHTKTLKCRTCGQTKKVVEVCSNRDDVLLIRDPLLKPKGSKTYHRHIVRCRVCKKTWNMGCNFKQCL